MQERAARRSALKSTRASDLPRVATGIVAEAAWIAVHAATYPLGLVPGHWARNRRRSTLADRGPTQRGLVHQAVAAAETPILLVHGIVDNHSIFAVLRYALRRHGFATISAYDYGLLTRDIPTAAALLGEEIARVAASAGYERIHVIGHSLGGLIARYHVQRQGGDASVHTLVTLGTPHRGTQWARALPVVPLLRQLAPDSDVVQELAQPAPGCRTRFVAFYSDLDQLVIPSSHARIDHPDLDVRNVALRGVGHLSLPNNRQVALEIAAALGDATEPAPQQPAEA